MTATELHWAAGVLEGEGNFTPMRHGARVTPRVNLWMSDADVIERIARLFEVPWRMRNQKKKKETYKDLYGFQLCSVTAVNIMEQVYPLMGERRAARINGVLQQWYANPPKRLYQRTKSLIASTHNKKFTLKQVADGQRPTPLLHSSLSDCETSSGPIAAVDGSSSTSTK